MYLFPRERIETDVCLDKHKNTQFHYRDLESKLEDKVSIAMMVQ